MDSKRLIKLIKQNYCNQDGILSDSYPPTNNHLLSDLDDFVPFFLHYGELDFVKDQILKSKNLVHPYGLVVNKKRIVSYNNNEFVGGIARYYIFSNDQSVIPILDDAINCIKNFLIQKDIITSYYDIHNSRISPICAPISGGLIEVLIENADICPGITSVAFNSLDQWIASETFKKYGLFVSKYHIDSKLWNKLFLCAHIPIPLKIQNRISTNFYMNGTWNNLIYNLPIGIKFQTSKDNTNMVFAIIEAYRKTRDEKYKNALIWWIKNFTNRMVINGKVYRFWQPPVKPKLVALDHVFPIVDILCDSYFYVEKDDSFLRLASVIIETCVKEIQWNNGLFPKELGGEKDHLDIQTDFIVSLNRLYELVGDIRYKRIADGIFRSLLKYHYTSDGYVTYVDKKGNIIYREIKPKYNALLLKAFILIEDSDFKIYGSDYNQSLMKDR